MTSTISAFTPAPIGAGGGIDRRGSRGRTRRRCKAFIPFLTLRTVSGKIITRANRDRRPDPKSLFGRLRVIDRSEEHTSELQSLMRISYAVLCLKKKNTERQKRQ